MELQATAVEEDGGLEVVEVAEAAGRLLEGIDDSRDLRRIAVPAEILSHAKDVQLVAIQIAEVGGI